MKKVLKLIVNPSLDNSQYIKVLEEKFTVEVIDGIKDSMDILKANAVLLIDGNSSINPQFYTERLGKHTTLDKTRDDEDRRLYDLTKKYKKLNIGFGRGAHLLTALSGGRIIQHVEGHKKNHIVACNKFKSSFTVSSNHTQMMYPYELPSKKFEIIAWSKKFESITYLDGQNQEIKLDEDFLEPEIVRYDVTNSICFESDPNTKDYKEVVLNIIDSYLN